MPKLLIAGGRVIDPASKVDAVRDVLLEDGKVAAVAAGLSKRKDLAGVETLAAKDLWVVPGLIDMHVHLREPGREGDETIASGTRAAAAGGVTTVLAMPNTEPSIDNPSLVNFIRAKAAAEGAVNVLVAGAATLGQKGEALTETHKLVAAGARAITDDGMPVMNSELMRRALEHAKDCGVVFIDHCEDHNLSGGNSIINEGFTATVKGLRGVPWASETVMVLRDIALAELTGARVHIAHISAAQSVEAVRAAKKRGILVTAEAAPHHFSLTDADIEGYDANFKMNPPLRGERDVEAVLEGLSDGTIDAIATDHAPHGPGKKALGLAHAPNGVIGLESSLGVSMTELFHKKLVDAKRLVHLMSAGPAGVLGLSSKGRLSVGADADVTLIDPNASWKPGLPLASKSRNCPFLGKRLKGRARAAIVGGVVKHAL